jgi:tetratricopeptide (TPR) repeat protein
MKSIVIAFGLTLALFMVACNKIDSIINSDVNVSTDTAVVAPIPEEVSVSTEVVKKTGDVKKSVASPKTAKDYYMSGTIKVKRGMYVNAVADYDKAIKLDPYYAEAYNARALTKDKINDFNGAVVDYEKAIQTRNIKGNKTQLAGDADIKNVTFHMQQGKIKIDLYDYDGADKDFTKAINIIPSYGPAYIARGDARLKSEKYYDALSDYNRAMKFWPKLTYDSLRKIGNLEMHFENYDKAVEAYRNVVDYDKNNVDSRYKLTDVLIMSGNFSDALNSIRVFYLISKDPYVYSSDYHRWNIAINKYSQDSTANELKSKINKLKIIRSN